MPKISVIVPVYNTEKYIKKCIMSILNQTMQDIEIIIVNDGSTDNSENIIKEIMNNNNTKIEIKYFLKENGGLSEARNYGVKQATGKYLSFVDSDDYIDENLYKNLEKYIDENIDVIKFKMETVDENYKTIEKLDGPIFETTTGENAFKNMCIKDTFLDVACIYLYKREFFIGNNFEYMPNTYHEDFGLTPLVIIQAKTLVSTKYFGYYYLQRKNSITSVENKEKEIKKAYDVLKHYDNAMKKIDEMQIDENSKKLIRRYYTNTLLLKAKTLEGKEQQKFIEEIKKRKVYKNIKAENIKQFIKREILKFNIKLYIGDGRCQE